jgi:hypothetical protein
MTRFAAGAAGFLTLIQSGERPGLARWGFPFFGARACIEVGCSQASIILVAAGAVGFLILIQATKLHKLPSLPNPNRDNGND